MADSSQVYRVAGVDRRTEADVELDVTAASEANARVKAELRGLVVTSVRLANFVPPLTADDLVNEEMKRLGISPQRGNPSTIEFARKLLNRQTDWAAAISFASGLLSLALLPILLVPVCYIFSWVSYYRLRDNPLLKGRGLRWIGCICGMVSMIYLFYLINAEQQDWLRSQFWLFKYAGM